jgi:hypothetical protein
MALLLKCKAWVIDMPLRCKHGAAALGDAVAFHMH